MHFVTLRSSLRSSKVDLHYLHKALKDSLEVYGKHRRVGSVELGCWHHVLPWAGLLW